MGRRWRWVRDAGLLCTLFASACARIEVRHPDGHLETMSKAEFKAYAEQVFRRQNHVVDQLIRADSGADSDAFEADARLTRAEEAMQDACRPLIALVSAKAERRRMDLADKLEMPRAVPACDAAVRAVEALLPIL